MTINEEGKTLLRVALEIRSFLAQAESEPEAQSLLADVEIVERVGRWLSTVRPIDMTGGIPTA